MLARVDSSVIASGVPDNSYEEWSIDSLNGVPFNSLQENFVYIGNQTIDSCNFNTNFNYTVNMKNNINTINNQEGCINKNISKNIEDMVFFIGRGRQMVMYNSNLE